MFFISEEGYLLSNDWQDSNNNKNTAKRRL